MAGLTGINDHIATARNTAQDAWANANTHLCVIALQASNRRRDGIEKNLSTAKNEAGYRVQELEQEVLQHEARRHNSGTAMKAAHQQTASPP